MELKEITDQEFAARKAARKDRKGYPSCPDCDSTENTFDWGRRCPQCQRSWDARPIEWKMGLPDGYRAEAEGGRTFLGNVTYKIYNPDGAIVATGWPSPYANCSINS